MHYTEPYKVIDSSFQGIDPETFLAYVGDAAKAPSSLTRYNQAGLELLPRKSYRYIDGKRTFYHPLSVIEFLTADFLNKGKLNPEKPKNNLTQLQNEDVFFARVNAYAYAMSDAENSSESLAEFRRIIRQFFPLIAAFTTRTDVVRGKASSIKMNRQAVLDLREHNFKILTESFKGNKDLASGYINWITELYAYTFLNIFADEWNNIMNLHLYNVKPSRTDELTEDEVKDLLPLAN